MSTLEDKVSNLDRGVVHTLPVTVEVAFNKYTPNSPQGKSHAKYLKDLQAGLEPKYVEEGRWQVKNSYGVWQPLSAVKDLVTV